MGRTVIVTGDSRGLGAKITSKVLSKTEFSVLGISRTVTDEIDDLQNKCKKRYTHISFDLSELEKIKKLYKKRIKGRGPIYGIVNNAAMPYDDIVTNADVNTLRRSFEVNVMSAVILSKYSIRDMILNGVEGSIVNITSVSTSTGYSGLSMYGATKGALEAFSLGVAREWGRKGIRSNCVAPGFMETDMTDTLNDTQKERIYSRTSLGEETSQDSVASLVKFLLSKESKSITGEVIRVDSGTI